MLLELRNVSRAAERLGLSQSAVSAVLAKLREYFKDDLLALDGRRMYPTPFAEQLLPSLKACLAATDTMLLSSRGFDPATAVRTFRVVSSDYAHTAFLVSLTRKFAAEAPGIRLEFVLPDQASTEALVRGEMDLLISPPEYVDARHPTELLYRETFVVAGCRNNPIFGQPLTTEKVMEAGHIAVAIGSDRRASAADREMLALFPDRRVVAVASSFAMVAAMLVETSHLTLMHRRLAVVMSRHLPIAFASPPFAIPDMQELVQYHRTRAADPGVRWLVGESRSAAEVVPAG